MVGIFYSVLSYLGFLAVYCYFAAFSSGVLVAKSVESGHADNLGLALVVNLGLVLLFGLQHSIMARTTFKQMLTRLIPSSLERATYVFASSVTVAAVIWLWQPMDGVVWHVESSALSTTLWLASAIGWLGVPLCSLMIDHFNLFGLKQAFFAFRQRSTESSGFVTPLLYRYVRHPMMTSFFVAFWATPHMSLGHLLLSSGMSVYILIGVYFEERSLLRELGSPYAKYQATTPRFVPGRSARKLVGETTLVSDAAPASTSRS
jgi:protein-S-isoprenylcysteine O-methyltransferase Ste14